MNYIEAFEERLRSLFRKRAEEFSRYAEEEKEGPRAAVTHQLASIYSDLAEALSH